MSNDVIIFSKYSHYSNDLHFFLKTHKCHYKEIASKDLWVRDYFFQGLRKTYIRNKNSEYAKTQTFEKYGFHKVQTDYLPGTDDIYPWMHADDERFLHDSDVQSIEQTLKSSNRALEGGNLFQCKNKYGKTFHLIGERALFAEKALFLHKHPGAQVSPGQILSRYKRIFGPNVIIVPNLTYHLDLQMSYIKQGLFILNDFSSIPLCFRHVYEKTVIKSREIRRLLQDLGFTVIMFPLVIYDTEKLTFSNGVSHNFAATSNLANGINITSNINYKKLFITLDTDNETHKRNFTRVLSENGVIPLFANRNGMTAVETQSIFTGGGLRCQTNMIRINPHNVAATKIQSMFRSHALQKQVKPAINRNREIAAVFFKDLRLFSFQYKSHMESQHFGKTLFQDQYELKRHQVKFMLRLCDKYSNRFCYNYQRVVKDILSIIEQGSQNSDIYITVVSMLADHFSKLLPTAQTILFDTAKNFMGNIKRKIKPREEIRQMLLNDASQVDLYYKKSVYCSHLKKW
ncbi:hypothetical protein P0136_05315 [Lentisphaerota bacterium ZTH]|nr:hypothetical protein JYG24_03570 [Lentisphaerota bacterium]WET07410.1 hypothetical protein P0136_05315 [Lentisphaerota bacterium ZTH]